MLRKVKGWHHLFVAAAIVALALLAGFRVIGGGDASVWRAEHFDAKQVTVYPVGEGVRIREVVDVDFGTNQRRGYQRIVPNDFGVPVDITASSPDANDDVSAVEFSADTRIRVGDPNITFSGRHRYVLEYTLPDANLSSGQLALDIIGTDETSETDRFEVVLTGFDLVQPLCNTGSYGSFGGCELTLDSGGNYVTLIEPLAPGAGITVEGTIGGLTEPTPPPEPAQPDPIPTGFQPLGYLMVPLGLTAALGVYRWGRRYGSNEVIAGGATEAAFGTLQDTPTYRVPDSRLAEMATTEFVPPRGIEPWQGSMLLREEVDDDTVSAWFSEMVARDALTITEPDGDVVLTMGPESARLDAVDSANLASVFAHGPEVELGKYNKSFTATWKTIMQQQKDFASASGWWSRGAPGARPSASVRIAGTVLVAVIFVAVTAMVLLASGGFVVALLASPWVAVALGILIPLRVALAAYKGMFAARTATGSALALRTESFRRFLAASEGRHVEWAWEQGLVREYSAWAVALGAASAWKRAIEASNIPDPDIALGGPLVLYTASAAFTSSHTSPRRSSGGSGVGGGSVGGGGGGGSSGSW